MRRLYPTHVPSTGGQKVLLGLSAAVSAMIDPRRAEQVARLGEVTGRWGLEAMREAMQSDPEGRRVLEKRPVFQEWVDLSVLSRLAPDSLGAQYASFMLSHGFHPRSRPPVRYVDDPELAYIMARYRDLHDIFHVLFHFSHVSVDSEVQLKLAEAFITRLPMTFLAAAVGPLRLSSQARLDLFRRVLPWAYHNCSPRLLSVFYEERMEQPIDQVRASLNIQARH